MTALNIKVSLEKILSKYNTTTYALIEVKQNYSENQKKALFTQLLKQGYSITKIAAIKEVTDSNTAQNYSCDYSFTYFVVNKNNDTSFAQDIKNIAEKLQFDHFYINTYTTIELSDFTLCKITDRCDFSITDLKSIATIRSLKQKEDFIIDFY